jgi:hypothetical protein
VFCEWARASPAFGDADAAIFVDVRFADVFDEAPFPLKLRLIEICRILAEHLSGDAVVRVVNRAVIQAFAEIVESEEIEGMKELYHLCGTLLLRCREDAEVSGVAGAQIDPSVVVAGRAAD